jgi:hypothetical protein
MKGEELTNEDRMLASMIKQELRNAEKKATEWVRRRAPLPTDARTSAHFDLLSQAFNELGAAFKSYYAQRDPNFVKHLDETYRYCSENKTTPHEIIESLKLEL